jgi:hypothetical protein
MPSPFDGVRRVIHDARDKIQDAGAGIRTLAEDMGGLAGHVTEDKPQQIETPETTETQAAGVSDVNTLKYQIHHLIDNLDDLEMHLAEGCQIMGVPCDCCGKHASRTRRFAIETIPIAGRQGQDPYLFTEVATWSGHIENIGSEQNARSGKYKETYIRESGNASSFRKKLQKLQSSLEGEECPGCEEMKDSLSEYIRERESGGV